jgi:hypothetical protein
MAKASIAANARSIKTQLSESSISWRVSSARSSGIALARNKRQNAGVNAPAEESIGESSKHHGSIVKAGENRGGNENSDENQWRKMASARFAPCAKATAVASKS